jgi:hypothetical protein
MKECKNKLEALFTRCLLTVFIIHSPLAYAYLDPGTGSLILQSIIAIFAGAAVTCKIYWEHIKAFFRIKKSPKKDTNSNDNSESS